MQSVVAEAKVGEEVEVVAVATTVEAVVEAKTARIISSSLGEQVEAKTPNIKGPSTLICQLETGRAAPCISAGAGPPFSVPNPVPAHGRMFLNKSETVTSPAIWILNY